MIINGDVKFAGNFTYTIEEVKTNLKSNGYKILSWYE